MNITVFGAGGVGGYMAARLCHAIGNRGGHTLSLVARGRHLDAIREHGLTYSSASGADLVVRPAAAADSPADLPSPDLVILCVKGYDLDSAVNSFTAYVKPDTLVLPLLNGADIDERVRQILNTAIVFPGCIYISAFIENPGHVRHAGGAGNIVFGTSPDSPDTYPGWFVDLCADAEIPIQWQTNPAVAIWTKFLFIAPFSLVTAVSGEDLGSVISDATLSRDARAIVTETAQIARRKLVDLADNAVDATMEKAASFPAETRTSFQRDIAAGNPRDERDIFAGTILRLGKQLGVPTPVTARYAALLP